MQLGKWESIYLRGNLENIKENYRKTIENIKVNYNIMFYNSIIKEYNILRTPFHFHKIFRKTSD